VALEISRDGSSLSAFVAEEDGEIVCHYGTIRQGASIGKDRNNQAWDAIDVMAHPRQQGRGLFRRTVQAFMRESCEGQGLFLYGFPTARHKRLGEILVGYEPVARVHKVSKLLSPTLSGKSTDALCMMCCRSIGTVSGPRVQEHFVMLTRRDHAYLAWRYLARPDRR